MAIIYSYPTATPKASDLLIGTVTYDSASGAPVDGNPTRTFSIGDIANLVSGYALSSQAAGVNANIVLTSSLGAITAVNLLRGAGISISDNGSNGITLGNTGVLSIVASNSTFVSSTPVLSATGNVTISSSLSAVGTPSSSNYLRGDNRWSTPVTTITTQDSQYINLTPNSSSNGAVTITAQLSATGSPSSSNFLRGDNVWAVPAGGGGGGGIASVNAGTGIAVDNSDLSNPIVSNTAPDQVVAITGTGAAVVSGTYPNFNVEVVAGEQGVISKDSFVGDGIETQYQLSVTPTSATYTEVFISGVYQEASTYTLSADTITLSAAPDSGDTLEIVTFNLGTPGSGGGGGGGAVDSIIAGAGISVSGPTGNVTITNNLPDQTVALTGAGGTTITGTYPNFTVSSTAGGGGVDSVVGGTSITVDNTDPLNPIINNSSPDQTVALTGSGAATVTGTYPNFNVDATNTTYTAGTGLSLVGTEFSNTAPDQTVALTGTGSSTITGTYPNFNVDTPVIDTNDFITNANDVYPSVNKVTDIISLTQAEYDALTPDESAIYVIIG